MNNDLTSDSGAPSESEMQANTAGGSITTRSSFWRRMSDRTMSMFVSERKHHHAFFVLAVLTRYKIKIYEHRNVHEGEIGKGIESWKKKDETLAIEEGRRQLQEQRNELQYQTTRASVLLPTATTAAIYFLTRLDDLADVSQPWQWIARILLLAGSVSAFWGALVMVALIGDRAPLKQTDAVELTSEPGNLHKYLARDYAENVPTGVDTNAARLTHLGTGVVWITIGALFGMIGVACSELLATSNNLPDHALLIPLLL
ncbi:MAG: hypothetical protein OXI96_09760 [Acidimicrobiaceae bacterium]|nr:hypothetical protein [Acidimicrobiaceae bacterium]